ncbi:LysM domain-containing protein [Achromobacter sp.]|uniref:LysM peptidoglycan-binding domain-containing protein n=1 Tax=Achromobacter sp. TaxID=134375 RepID=UPI0028A5D3DF|nr:LysM domain-containing protein [Achromobacter sp.]
MADQSLTDTNFQKWRDGLTRAVTNPKWNGWDCEIQMAVNEYNRHLSGKAGYVSLDWKMIKAMVWVETGANHSEWKVKPLQIGVMGDPGLHALLSSKEGGDLILLPEWKERMTISSVRTNPSHNIRAGIGYLLMRMANFKYVSVVAGDGKIHEIKVKPGDSLAKIASAQQSTLEVMQKLNPTAVVLRPGQSVKVQKAHIKQVITSWRAVTVMSVAVQYNSMRRDKNYGRKLSHAYDLVGQGLGVSSCAY